MSAALQRIAIARVTAAGASAAQDVAAVEEPLEIRLADAPFVVIMRTPGADRELTAGFLVSERIVSSADDIGVIRHCTAPDGASAPNVVNVTLAGDAAERVPALLAGRRAVAATSACGVCGRQSIEDLMTGVAPLRAAWRVSRGTIDALPHALRAAQDAFAESGGLHAAGLFDRGGHLVAAAEDVGRHNAVDKVIGRQVLMEQPLDERILFVSGRAGYEIVQKALVAGIPVVAAVSAPTSLAIALANEGGVTLLGFVRDGSFNVYAGAGRVDAA